MEPKLNLFHLVGNVIKAIGNKALELGTVVCTGSVSGGIPRVELPDGGTLTAQQCRGYEVATKGRDDDALIAMPPIFEGAHFMLLLEVTVAKYVRLDPDSAEVIIFDKTTLTGGYYVGMASAVAGGKLAVIARYEGATLIWEVTTLTGTFAAQA